MLFAERFSMRRDFDAVVRGAIISMSQALEGNPPGRALLEMVTEALTSQSAAALRLEEQARDLLPAPSPAGRDVPPWDRLDHLTAVLAALLGPAQALGELELGLAGVLDQDELQDLLSSLVAQHYDIARDPCAKAQFVLAEDPGGPEDDPQVLAEALRSYRADMIASAVRIFADGAPGFSAQRDELRTARLIRTAATTIFADGVKDITCHGAPASAAPAADEAFPPQHPPCGGGPEAESSLQLADVFDVEDGSRWRASAQDYLPFFTFVVSELRQVDQLCRAHARLCRARTRFAVDAVKPLDTGDGMPGLALLPGLTGPVPAVIETLIGPRIADPARARQLAWRMSEASATIMRLLAGADAAISRLASNVADILATERAGYLAEIGPAPALDSVGRREMKPIAAGLYDMEVQQVRLLRLLLNQPSLLRRPGAGADSAPATAEPDLTSAISRVGAAVAAAEEMLTTCHAALVEGEYLRAACDLLRCGLPVADTGFPGLTLHQDLLAQARPLAVLSLAHRLLLSHWTATAAVAHCARWRSIAAAISAEIDEYGRAHEEFVQAVNYAIRIARSGGD